MDSEWKAGAADEHDPDPDSANKWTRPTRSVRACMRVCLGIQFGSGSCLQLLSTFSLWHGDGELFLEGSRTLRRQRDRAFRSASVGFVLSQGFPMLLLAARVFFYFPLRRRDGLGGGNGLDPGREKKYWNKLNSQAERRHESDAALEVGRVDLQTIGGHHDVDNGPFINENDVSYGRRRSLVVRG